MRQMCDRFHRSFFFVQRDECCARTNLNVIVAFNVEILLSINGAFACIK